MKKKINYAVIIMITLIVGCFLISPASLADMEEIEITHFVYYNSEQAKEESINLSSADDEKLKVFIGQLEISRVPGSYQSDIPINRFEICISSPNKSDCFLYVNRTGVSYYVKNDKAYRIRGKGLFDSIEKLIQ